MNSFEKPKITSEAENSEQTERIKEHLIEAFENGLDDKESIGFHGTSLEAVEYLASNGNLPGSAKAGELHGYNEGVLFFFPKKSAFPEHYPSDSFDDEDALEFTEDYAKFIARYHNIAKSLGLDLEKEEDRDLGKALAKVDPSNPIDVEEANEAIDILTTKRGTPLENINSALEKAKSRKGVIIALDKKAVENYKTIEGDDDSHIQDLAIICPEGLDYKCISGIEPLGQEEWDFFEKLQKEN